MGCKFFSEDLGKMSGQKKGNEEYTEKQAHRQPSHVCSGWRRKERKKISNEQFRQPSI